MTKDLDRGTSISLAIPPPPKEHTRTSWEQWVQVQRKQGKSLEKASHKGKIVGNNIKDSLMHCDILLRNIRPIALHNMARKKTSRTFYHPHVKFKV